MIVRLSILLEYDKPSESRKIERSLESAYCEGKRIVSVSEGEGFVGQIRSVFVQRGTSRDLETAKAKKISGGDAAAQVGVPVPDPPISKGAVQKRQRGDI